MGESQVPTEVNLLINAPWVGLLPFPTLLPVSPPDVFYKFTSQIKLLVFKSLSQILLLAQLNPSQHSMAKHG